MGYFKFTIELICAVTFLSLLAPIASLGVYSLRNTLLRKFHPSRILAAFNASYYLILTSTIAFVCTASDSDTNFIARALMGFAVLAALALNDAQENVKQIKQERVNAFNWGMTTFAQARFEWLIPIHLAAISVFPILCLFPNFLPMELIGGAVLAATVWLQNVPLIGFAFYIWSFFSAIGMLMAIATFAIGVSLLALSKSGSSQQGTKNSEAA